MPLGARGRPLGMAADTRITMDCLLLTRRVAVCTVELFIDQVTLFIALIQPPFIQ